MAHINGIPIYKIAIDDTDPNYGVSMMSIVDEPAVEKHFMAFDRHSPAKYSIDDEKRIIMGVALRADYPIYRNDGNGEYYVVFDEATIDGIRCKFMRELRQKDVNVQHAMGVDGVYMVDSFILNQLHQVTIPEFEDVAPGSWIVGYKVDNTDVWDAVKRGELRGFSVELVNDLIPCDDPKADFGKIYNLLNLIS